MNAYQEAQAARHARLMDTLTAIAPLLDGAWSVERPHDHNAQLVNADGVRIWGNIEMGRLELSAGVPPESSYSDGDTHGLDRPEISVSPDRTPVALARDINRRLLPAAVEYWQAVSERIARRLSALNSRETLARELAEIMGSTAREWRNDWKAELPDSFRALSTYTYGDLTPSHDASSVTVEIKNLPADRARELAALIRTWAES